MPLSVEDKEQIRNVGLLCAVAIGFLIMGPFADQGIGIKDLRTRIQTEKRKLEEERSLYDKECMRIDRIPRLEEELKERGPEIQRYEARLPKSKRVPELFRDIDRFKQKARLDIVVQTRLDPVDKQDYWELPIRIEARGSYDSIATFINYVERSQRFAQVKELEITEVPGRDSVEKGNIADLGIHDVVMVISTFMFVDQVPADEMEQTP